MCVKEGKQSSFVARAISMLRTISYSESARIRLSTDLENTVFGDKSEMNSKETNKETANLVPLSATMKKLPDGMEQKVTVDDKTSEDLHEAQRRQPTELKP